MRFLYHLRRVIAIIAVFATHRNTFHRMYPYTACNGVMLRSLRGSSGDRSEHRVG